ncbi:MAG: hypothetical protein ACT4PV_07255 [Planctomycetaceae bacterium]
MFLACLVLAVALAGLASRRRALRRVERLMLPADQLGIEDVDHWLALIEPFPFEHPTRR